MPARTLVPFGVFTLALVLCYFVYSPGLTGPWLLDDPVNILTSHLRALTWQEISANIFVSERLAGLSRSIGILSLAVTEYIYGGDTYPFKYQNLMLHLANGLLVFWFASLLFRASDKSSASNAYWFALACAALWLLHPLQVSTVLYVVQRLVLLSAFFSLLSLCLYIEGRMLARRRPYAGTALMLLALALFWPMAIISKENAVLIILIVPLVEYFLLGFRTHSSTEHRLFLAVMITFFALPLVVGGLYALANPEKLLLGYEGRDFTLPERLMSEAHALWLYVKLILFPIPGHMTLYHDGFPVQTRLDAGTLLAFAAWILWALAAVLLRRTAPLIGIGLLWFLVWHLLESTIIPLELVFEHRNYLALLGIVMAIVATAVPLLSWQRIRGPMIGAFLAILALLSANTAARAFVWSDFELMVRSAYQEHSNSPRVLEGLVAVESTHGDPETALEFTREYQALAPDSAAPVLREVLIRCRLPGGASEAFGRALELAQSGLLRPASVNLTKILIDRIHGPRGCAGVSEADVLHMTEALTLNTRAHTPSVRLGAFATHLKATALAGDWTRAKSTASQLLQGSVNYSPSLFAESVQSVVEAASLHSSYDDAVGFIDDVTRPYAETLKSRRIRVYLRHRPRPSTGGEPDRLDQAQAPN